MRNSYDNDGEGVEQRLRQARARESQLWGRTVATAEVTPAMARHTDQPGARCICDACGDARTQPNLRPTLKARTIVNQRQLRASVSGTDDSGRPYGPRRETYQINRPDRAPDMTDRQIAFLLRLRGRR